MVLLRQMQEASRHSASSRRYPTELLHGKSILGVRTATEGRNRAYPSAMFIILSELSQVASHNFVRNATQRRTVDRRTDDLHSDGRDFLYCRLVSRIYPSLAGRGGPTASTRSVASRDSLTLPNATATFALANPPRSSSSKKRPDEIFSESRIRCLPRAILFCMVVVHRRFLT